MNSFLCLGHIVVIAHPPIRSAYFKCTERNCDDRLEKDTQLKYKTSMFNQFDYFIEWVPKGSSTRPERNSFNSLHCQDT
jgi:hypothetical protein